jgi:hypothetical protein
MIINRLFVEEYLKKKYPLFELTDDQIIRYVNFCNYLLLLRKIETDRYMGLHLDVLSRLEDFTIYIKYVTGSGQRMITTIRTDMIDRIFEYTKTTRNHYEKKSSKKRKFSQKDDSQSDTLSNESFKSDNIKSNRSRGRPCKQIESAEKIINVNLQNDDVINRIEVEYNEMDLGQVIYIDINGNVKYFDTKTLDSFEIDMSLFDKRND